MQRSAFDSLAMASPIAVLLLSFERIDRRPIRRWRMVGQFLGAPAEQRRRRIDTGHAIEPLSRPGKFARPPALQSLGIGGGDLALFLRLLGTLRQRLIDLDGFVASLDPDGIKLAPRNRVADLR